MDGFSITFSDKSSISHFPSNRINNFRYRKEPGFNFSKEKWEVALKSISFPKSWFNLNEDCTFGLKLPALLKNGNVWTTREYTHTFEKGFYSSFDEIVEKLRYRVQVRLAEENYVLDEINEQIGAPQYHFISFMILWHVQQNSTKTRCRLSVPVWEKNRHLPIFPGEITIDSGVALWNILGFDFKVGETYKLPQLSTTDVKIKLHLPLMFVLAPNLIEPQIFSDNLQPVLDMVPVDIHKPGALLHFNSPYPIYKQVVRGYINTINIELRDNFWQPFEFQSGNITLVLHFRKCQSKTPSDEES